MQYRDFIIRIGEARGEAYEVRAESNAGEGSGRFEVPFSEAELARLRYPPPQRSSTRPDAPLSAQEIGEQLFRALFRGDVGSLFDRTLGEIETCPHVGLRIKLKFDLRRTERLAALPWELLREERGDFLALDRQTPIVRYLEVKQRRVSQLALSDRLRILAVVSPAGDAALDLEREEHYLRGAFTDSNVELTVVHAPSLEELRQRLLDEDFHVLHFMGHGRHGGRGGHLVFADKKGIRKEVSGSTLAAQLRGISALRLVFLNACQSAQSPSRAGSDPFAGVASALVGAGVPAVLAMQHSISDTAATTFSRAFYMQLAKGTPIDTASVEGRLAVQRAEPDTAEWCLPVLFMRVADGQLFLTSGDAPASGSFPTLAVPPDSSTGAVPVPLFAAPPAADLSTGTFGATLRQRFTPLRLGIGLAVLLAVLLVFLAPWRGPDRGLILSEVFYDAPDKDDEREWVELYNAGRTAVDLAGYSIGAGGEDYTKTLISLIGRVEPGRTFVVGGPRSDEINGHPAFDQEQEISPDLQNGSKSGKADGVALFAVPASEVTSTTRPIDVVIYGTANSNHLIDETGTAPEPYVSLGPSGSSLERIDLEKGWVLRSQPTPNRTPLNSRDRQ